ncbi:GNAT family N-acetyltransferase [Actinokineospora sp. HBU206404]|uniref:GNAT family N-acetyltransferase n=2 Tax=Actinokineospora xionganensis TaxID=2684470 RepID=A0ABR7LD46_9PSEU|nr:GNAT family N-acetyltransferase [Actinokineospora xionganensis]
MIRPSPMLTGDVVVLRRLRPDEVEALVRVVEEAVPHLRPWMAWAAGEFDPDSVREHVAETEAKWEAGTEFTYAITVGGKIAGRIGLMSRVGEGGLEIGYWLHPAHVGIGAATESTSLLVKAAFELPGIEFVDIVHDTANVRSEAIPRKLGFTEISRTSPPQEPITSGEDGVDVRWRLTRDEFHQNAP